MLGRLPSESSFERQEVRRQVPPGCLSTATERDALAVERLGLPGIEDDRAFACLAEHVVAVD